MPHVPTRPPALEHLSDEAASIVLARHFGDIVKAACDLGVDRKALRRLTWHNPRILAAAHERGLIHRDIKPGNVMITDDGLVYEIPDYDLALQGLATRDGMARALARQLHRWG